MSTRAVEVKLPSRTYEVRVGAGALNTLAESTRSMVGPSASRAFLVVDTGVPGSFVDQAARDLESQGFVVNAITITPSEQIKSIATYAELLVQIAATGHTRVDPIIAIGGGVVGDLAGFAAASYQRGVPVIQCPTTLLSMVDASVGGKTGFNLASTDQAGNPTLYKNLVGAFHQPRLVIADMAVLDSLDARYRRAGLAECVKHAMICATIGDGQEGLMDWMNAQLDGICAFDPSTIEEFVARNTALKATVVVRDEHESSQAKAGGRMLLNFGHTFGHAIETIDGLSPDPTQPNLAPLHHGEAVALGMIAAAHAAHAMGQCKESVVSDLESTLGSIGLPIRVAGLPATGEVIERMTHDKKAAGGSMRVILPIGRGECAIVSDPDPSKLAIGINAIRADEA